MFNLILYQAFSLTSVPNANTSCHRMLYRTYSVVLLAFIVSYLRPKTFMSSRYLVCVYLALCSGHTFIRKSKGVIKCLICSYCN